MRPNHVALEALFNSANDFQQGGFTRSIQTNDANFGSVVKTQVDVLEDCFVVVWQDF